MYTRKFGLLLAAVCITEILVAVCAHATGVIRTYDVYSRPSDLEKIDAKPQTLTTYVACYGRDGQIRLPIDCSFKLWVSYPPGEDSDPEVNGGHVPAGYSATSPRPLIYRKRHYVPNLHGRPTPVYEGPGKLEFVYDTDPTDNKQVTGGTINGCPPSTGLPVVCRSYVAKITYPVPEAGGEARMDLQVTLPPTWFCVQSWCYTNKMYWNRNIVHIMTWDIWDRSVDPKPPKLVELPDPGPNADYAKLRGHPDVGHPDSVAFFIKPQHLPQLYALADIYFLRTNGQRLLYLNDMTLPLGGLFDIYHNWTVPHRSHRDGTDADVDVKPYGIKCRDDKELIKAARAAIPQLRGRLGGYTDSAVLCESGGRKHIDFER